MDETKLSAILPLSDIEQQTAHQLYEIFQMVSPAQPEKGIVTLIERAREEQGRFQESYTSVLNRIVAGARERTERRVALLGQCDLPSDATNQLDP